MQFLEVVFNVPIDSAFFYKSCDAAVSGVGKRVSAYFGKRKLVGFVVGERDELPKDFPADVEVKAIERFIDAEVLFTEQQIRFAKKIAEFYLCSAGEVLSCMLPSAKRENSADGFGLSVLEFASQRIVLSDEQQNAVNEISAAIFQKEQAFFYLFGITGSGKTEVYLQAIKAALQKGLGVIYLVPEIA